MKQSGAVVNLSIGNQNRTYAVANVPGEDTVEWWHVFDIVVGGGQGTSIVDVMTFEVSRRCRQTAEDAVAAEALTAVT